MSFKQILRLIIILKNGRLHNIVFFSFLSLRFGTKTEPNRHRTKAKADNCFSSSFGFTAQSKRLHRVLHEIQYMLKSNLIPLLNTTEYDLL